MDNIFDLFIDYDFGPSLQDNLVRLDKLFGNNFYVKYMDFMLPVRLEKFMIDTDKSKAYKLYYDLPQRTTYLKPFSIYFIDPNTKKLNNNSYIANIHKTEDIRGSDMVHIVLEINRKLGVKRTSLNDGATILCGETEVDLSFIKLIERGLTFYMKFGFEFEITNTEWFGLHFKNLSQLKSKVHELTEKIKKIKIKTIIAEYEKTLYVLAYLIKTQSYDKFDMELFYGGPTFRPQEIYNQKDPSRYVNQLFIECHSVLDILNRTDKIFLYEYLIDLFNDPDRCTDYMTLINYLAETDRYKIQVGNIKIARTYPQLFSYLRQIRYNFSYVYHFE